PQTAKNGDDALARMVVRVFAIHFATFTGSNRLGCEAGPLPPVSFATGTGTTTEENEAPQAPASSLVRNRVRTFASGPSRVRWPVGRGIGERTDTAWGHRGRQTGCRKRVAGPTGAANSGSD